MFHRRRAPHGETMKMRLSLLALVLGTLSPALGQQTPHPLCVAGPEATFQDDLLDKLAGKWTLSGNMMGRELLQGCSGEWVLHHKFMRLDCRETRHPPLLGVRYESSMYVGCSSDSQRYVVYLLDIFGGGDTLGFGHRIGQAFQFTWASPNSVTENTFTWDAESGVWTSSIRQKDRSGQWKVFAEKKLRRN
jgi:hypothetical protein